MPGIPATFPGNFNWSRRVALARTLGCESTDIDSVVADLKELAGPKTSCCAGCGSEVDAKALAAWYRAWVKVAETARREARAAAEKDDEPTASRRYLHASLYELIAGTETDPTSSRSLGSYERALQDFREGAGLSGVPVEWVDIPFEGTTLPALHVPAADECGPSAAVIHFANLGGHKEVIHLVHAAGLRGRGIAGLFVDLPGAGGALLLRRLALRHDMEVAASACLSYLRSRGDVDADRVAVAGCGIGGHFAIRSAALVPGIAAAAVLAMVWDVDQWVQHSFCKQADTFSCHQFPWIIGAHDPRDILERLSHYKLDSIADRVTCPVLLVHGEDDPAMPVAMAKRAHAALVNSTRCDLKIFAEADGASGHMLLDGFGAAIGYIDDWLADVLQPRAAQE
ncbi:MAG: alpha/beta hydrolase family protein [Planctomycetota bacterium]